MAVGLGRIASTRRSADSPTAAWRVVGPEETRFRAPEWCDVLVRGTAREDSEEAGDGGAEGNIATAGDTGALPARGLGLRRVPAERLDLLEPHRLGPLAARGGSVCMRRAGAECSGGAFRIQSELALVSARPPGLLAPRADLVGDAFESLGDPQASDPGPHSGPDPPGEPMGDTSPAAPAQAPNAVLRVATAHPLPDGGDSSTGPL